MSELKTAELDYSADGLPLQGSAYTLTSELGSGSYATVYRAKVTRKDGQPDEVAVKILRLDRFEGRDEDDDKEFEMLHKEVTTMSQLRHENCISCLASFVEDRELWLVMKLMAGGSAQLLLKTLSPQGFTDEAVIATILAGALKGLEYLHKNGKLHRDIKAGNIFLGGDGSVVLGDLGVAGSMIDKGKKGNVTTFVGTPCYMAPEVVEQASEGYNTSADIWSLGITALELAYGVPPFAHLPPLKIMMQLLTQDPPCPESYGPQYRPRTAALSKDFKSFVGRCLRKEAGKRSSAGELLSHRFIKHACRDAAYLKAQLIDRLPESYLGAGSTEVIHRRSQATRERGGGGERKAAGWNKPVSIGSFIFDSDDLEELHQRAAAMAPAKPAPSASSAAAPAPVPATSEPAAVAAPAPAPAPAPSETATVPAAAAVAAAPAPIPAPSPQPLPLPLPQAHYPAPSGAAAVPIVMDPASLASLTAATASLHLSGAPAATATATATGSYQLGPAATYYTAIARGQQPAGAAAPPGTTVLLPVQQPAAGAAAAGATVYLPTAVYTPLYSAAGTAQHVFVRMPHQQHQQQQPQPVYYALPAGTAAGTPLQFLGAPAAGAVPAGLHYQAVTAVAPQQQPQQPAQQ